MAEKLEVLALSLIEEIKEQGVRHWHLETENHSLRVVPCKKKKLTVDKLVGKWIEVEDRRASLHHINWRRE